MIERYFTKDLYSNSASLSVYSEFEWKDVDVLIKDYQTGEIIFEGYELEFPEHYSQQACDIIASKYFYRNIDGEGTPETSLKQVVHRMVRFWVEALIEEGVIDGEWTADPEYQFYSPIDIECHNYFTGEAEILYDELVYTLLNQMWAPNSPQWFNTGIGYYGIKGESDEMYYCDENGIHESPDRYTRSQTSACFIIPVTDHLIGENSITDHFVTETKLFKGGSGVGTNFSPLRAAGESLSSGGKSSGVMSFLLGLDRNAGAIKSGGTTRRAAKMVILDVDHPDIEDFIDWKVHEEKKAQDLISLGYDGGMNGEAYLTVSGQNSNNSVRIPNEFMEKIIWNDPNSEWELKGRVDSSKDKVVDAHELWDKICRTAWECADPGIQFDDRYNEWHTAPKAGRINATNPCSEYAFLDNSACNLASINVLKFDREGEFGIDHERFENLVHLCQLVLEASIYWGQFPTKEVAKNSYLYRPTGLGLANLGALFLKKGYAYDSDNARNLAADLASIMTAQSYLTSAMIAEEIGACEGYDENAEDLINVVTKHFEQAEQDYWLIPCQLFHEALDKINNYGVRNMQVTVMAPTGTISFAMDCLTTGIEPFFSHKVFKKCSDGSMLEMVNPLAENYLTAYNSLDLEPHEFRLIQEYFDDYNTYQGAPYLDDENQKVLQTANEITPEAHVEMMAAIQPYISGSISKTVNLPHSATVEDVKKIYELAYKKGLKSISIYRDGSKGTQPLTTKKEEKFDFDVTEEEVTNLQELPYLNVIEKEEFEPKDITITVSDNQNYLIRASQEFIDIESNEPIITKQQEVKEVVKEIPQKFKRNKPEGVRNSRTHAAKIGNVELYITVSYYESGDLCEIFVSSDKEGTTTKGLLSSLSKAISHMLQYGIDPISIANMLKNQQYEPAGHTERHPYIKMASSISDMIARVIEFECGDYTRCHIKPEEDIKTTHIYPKPNEIHLTTTLKNEPLVVDPEKLAESTIYYLEEEIEKQLNREPLEIDDDFDLVDESEEKDYCPICGADYEYENDIGYCPNCQHTVKLPDAEEYTGNECPVCHSHRMVPNGTCEICLDCFNTSGCS